MDQKVQQEVAPPQLSFIRDEATSHDEFRSHTRIATAIATVIRSRSDLKVIGLLGPWGSGKSTILKLVESQLKSDLNPIEPHCFQYDAWLHQNDPPRRAFLETLIHYLIRERLPTDGVAGQLKKRLDQLNRRIEETEIQTTPTLTSSGRLIIWSLFALPLAGQFLSYQWFKVSGGSDGTHFEHWAFPIASFFLFLPAFLAVAIYLYWRPAKKPWTKDFWQTYRAPYDGDSVLSLVTNKQVQKVRNRITREPEPTTIEFQDFFREIMNAVSRPTRRFIFIIDNLDRLPESEAVDMWGTIRSFFLGAEETDHVRKANNLPTVILPVDEDAVRRMYKVSHPEDADALAQSFMDKTFDLTFRVTRPVLSDWQAYLTKQLQTVFGAYLQDDWPYSVGSLFEAFAISESKAVVTPRTINTLVNSIALLWLQWHSENITFSSIAYYVIFREQIDANIVKAISSPQARIDQFDPEWQRAIAGLHYGVPPSDAVQILIEQPLRKAISERNVDDFKKLALVRGFDRVFVRVLQSTAANDTVDPTFIFNTASLLDTVDLHAPYLTRVAWSTLNKGLRKTSSWKSIGPGAVSALATLQSHSESTESFIETVVTKLATVEEAAFTTANVTQSFIGISQGLISAARAKHMTLPKISVPGDANTFLTVVSQSSHDVALLSQLASTQSDANVVAQLANDLADQARAQSIERKFNGLLLQNKNFPWDALITAAAQIVEIQNASFASMPAALACLGKLRPSEKAAQAQIQRLADQAHLTNRLNESHGANNVIVEARSAALLMSVKPDFPAPNGLPWDKVLTERPDLAKEIEKALLEFSTGNSFADLLALANANSGAKPLIRSIEAIRIREKRIGALEVLPIVERLPQYLDCIEDSLRDEFLSQMANHPKFWDDLAGLHLNENVIALMHGLIRRNEQRKAVDRCMQDKLGAVSAADWEAAIRSGKEPYLIAVAIVSPSVLLQVSSNLFDALQKLIMDVLTNPDSELRTRWFRAVTFIPSSARETLYRNMQDRITSGSQVGDMGALLGLAGQALIQEGGFDDDPDGSVRHVILPLLSSSPGIEWLLNSAMRAQIWIEGSKEGTRDFLKVRLYELYKAGDEVAKSQLQKLQIAWSLPELTIGSAEETDNIDSATKPDEADGKGG